VKIGTGTSHCALALRCVCWSGADFMKAEQNTNCCCPKSLR